MVKRPFFSLMTFSCINTFLIILRCLRISMYEMKNKIPLEIIRKPNNRNAIVKLPVASTSLPEIWRSIHTISIGLHDCMVVKKVNKTGALECSADMLSRHQTLSLKRWPNIEPSLAPCLMFAEFMPMATPVLTRHLCH